MSSEFQPGRHLNADQFSALVEQALPAHERQLVLAHLAGCAECRSVLYQFEQLSSEAVPELPPQPKVTPILVGKRWSLGWSIAWSGAAAAAVLACAVILVHLRPAPKAEPTTAATVTSSVKPQESLAPAVLPPASPAQSVPRSITKVPPRPAEGNGVATETPSATVADSSQTNNGPLGLKAPHEKIEVSSTAAEIATLQSAPGAEVVQGQTVRDLPLNGRSFVQMEQLATPRITLPSHLAVASMVSHERRILAIDASGTLFFSQDGGQHWKKVRARWPGRVMTVSLVSSVSQPQPQASFAPNTAEPQKGKALGAVVATAAPVAGVAGDLTGVVTDPTGAVVPNATIKLSNSNTLQEQTAITDALGRYRFANLKPGTYQLTAESSGFGKQAVNGIVIGGPRTEDVNVALAVGRATENVVVEATSVQIQTDSAEPERAQPKKRATATPAVFELKTDTGAIWTSSDGRHWNPR